MSLTLSETITTTTPTLLPAEPIKMSTLQARPRTFNGIFLPKTSTTTTLAEFDDQDQGLVMLLDSKLENRTSPPQQLNLGGTQILRTPVPQQQCEIPTTVSFTAATASLLSATQTYYVKTVNRLNAYIHLGFELDVTRRIVPIVLYLSLLFLATQALGVLTLLLTSPVQGPGLWFILSCIGAFGPIFYITSEAGLALLPTPAPTPSHSAASIISEASSEPRS